ncbi:MAG: manganese efflux pump [Ruminococcus flavefaciens]|nr:manganese efflux pump [Ruminococcus flavefaciens]
MYDEIFLAVIVSLDTYLASATYCNSGIKIPMLSMTVISLISAGVLGLSLEFSGFIGRFVPSEICHVCGTAVISAIGIITIFKSIIRSIIKHISEKGEVSVRSGKYGIVMKLYLDETTADFDNSKILSATEAITLALASSLDSASTGLSSGFAGINPFYAFLFTFIAGLISITLGNITGKKLSSLHHDFSWVGGVLLIIFAFSGI